MQTFFVTLVLFVAFIFLMAVGYILAGKRIKGSCGGMNNLVTGDDGKERCSLCGISYEEQVEQGCGEEK